MSCPGPHRPHHPHQSICSSSDDSDSEEENQHRSKRVKMEQGKSAHPIKTEAEEDMVPPTEDGFDFRSFYDSFNGSGAPLCFSHALRFSHRQSPHPNIPPSEENRLKHNTTGSTRDGYLLVADPVVTEHYEEIEIPLYSSIHRTEEEKELLSVVSQLEQYLRLFLYEKQKLTLLLLHRNLLSDQYDKSHPLANLNAHPSSTAVREEKERISNRFNYKHLSTIDRSSDATSGVKGGVSCFDKIYRYGDVESKDYFHSMSYLSSTAAVAREEGWLVPRLAALRRTLFPTTHKDEEAFLVSFTSTKSEDQPKTGFKAEPQTEEGTLLLDPHSLASWTAVTTAPASPEYNAVLSQSNFYRPPTTASHTHLLSELEYDIISFLLLFSSDASLFYYYQQCLSVVGEELSVLVDVAQRQHEPNSSPSAYLPVHPSIYKEVPSPTLTHAVPPNPAENNNNNNKYEDMSNRFYFLNGIALTNEKKANFSHFNDIIKLKQFRKELLTEIDKMNKIISHKKVIETLQSL
ncbi:hypothetical protein ADEAN_000755900 [Angomonas deanei]|uniref:Uncharacterized protein n=1 Tax=Angomonas deanei TaxID=59799 RepID=A0A7G2CKX6_9TRYP|nr:hypothetical protein ADEAN_000755900 [Angomonas deanei]